MVIPHPFFLGLQPEENFVATLVSVVDGVTSVYDVADRIGTETELVCESDPVTVEYEEIKNLRC